MSSQRRQAGIAELRAINVELFEGGHCGGTLDPVVGDLPAVEDENWQGGDPLPSPQIVLGALKRFANLERIGKLIEGIVEIVMLGGDDRAELLERLNGLLAALVRQ